MLEKKGIMHSQGRHVGFCMLMRCANSHLPQLVEYFTSIPQQFINLKTSFHFMIIWEDFCEQVNVQLIEVGYVGNDCYYSILSFNSTLNEFMPRKKVEERDRKVSKVACSSLEHNHLILAFYLQQMDPQSFNKIFPDKTLKGCFDHCQIVKSWSNLFDKFQKDIFSTRDCPGTNTKYGLLWIHHSFLL